MTQTTLAANGRYLMAHQSDPPETRTVVSEFTGFELVALLSVADTDAALRTQVMLHLPVVEADSPTIGIGMSTLIARGQMLTDDTVRPVDDAAAVAAVCAAATTWVETTVISGKKKSVALFVSAPGAAVLLEPAPYGIWKVWPITADQPVERAAAGYVNGVYQSVTTGPFGASIEVIAARGPIRTAAVRISDDGVWRLQHGELDRPNPPEQIDADPTFSVLVDAVQA